MRRLRVLVVDDEPPARLRLEELLAREEDVELVACVEGGWAAVEVIERERPDLVFLDVQMPEVDGLEVVARIGPEHMPAVIFVTAFDRYALRAFDLAAVDYLLKPFDDERFGQALARARRRLHLTELDRTRAQLAELLSGSGWDSGAFPEGSSRPVGQRLRRLAIPRHGRTAYLPVERVDFIAAAGVYEKVHSGDAVHLVREGMDRLERRLDGRRFARIHRSTIVNLDRIIALEPLPGGHAQARLRDGTALRVSRRRRADLERRLASG